MKRFLCLFLALVFAVGICFSAPVTITASATEGESQIDPQTESDGTYEYALNQEGTGYILCGLADGATIEDEITLPATYNEKSVVELKDNAFDGVGGITSVTIPGTYEKIGAYVFCDCTELETLEIKEGTKEIGVQAFSDCNKLANVTLPESLENIGEGAFSETAYDKNKDVNPNEKVSDGTYIYQLTKDETGYILHGPVVNDGVASVNGEITLPETYNEKSVVELKDKAFEGIGGITSVTIPGTYKKIGAYAFCDSTTLETVVVEDGVEEIGMEAFSDCNKLSNISFPTSLKSVGRNVVIETAYYDNEANWVEGLGGSSRCLYIGDCLVAGELLWTQGEQIKYGTRLIADYALLSTYNTDIVKIPRTVKIIGDCGVGYRKNGADFEKIDDFKVTFSVTLDAEENVVIEYAEKNGFECEVYDFEPYFSYKLNEDGTGYNIISFSYHGWYEEIEIPASHNGLPVKQVGSDLGYSIFYACPHLKSVYIPETVEVLGWGLFQNCSNLNEIIIPKENNLKDVCQAAFQNTAYFDDEKNWGEDGALYLGSCLLSVANVDKSHYDIKEGTKGIAATAFSAIKTTWNTEINDYVVEELPSANITSVDIPESVVNVSMKAFLNDSYMSTTDHNNNIIKITGGENIVTIGERAFELPKLKEFSLGSKVEYIGDSAFYWCGKEVEGESKLNLTIPDTVKYIGSKAFYETNIKTVNLPTNLVYVGEKAFYGCEELTSTEINSVDLKELPADLFYECPALKSVSVSEACKYLCAEKSVVYNKDKTKIFVILPGFDGELTVSKDVTGLDISNLLNCSSITSVVVDEGNSYFSSVEGVLYNKTQTKAIYCPRTKTEVALPNTVTEIGEYAFQGCSQLTSVSGKSVEKVEQYAFERCGALTDISKMPSITEIGDYAFQYAGIVKLGIDENGNPANSSLKFIGESAFSGCNLTKVIIPDTVEEIGGFAFSINYNLNSLTIGEGVKVLGESAFKACSELEINNIEIKADIESLGADVFSETKVINTENWDDQYLYIDDYLVAVNGDLSGDIVLKKGIKGFCRRFFGYTPDGVNSITIPGSVIAIPDGAFAHCTNMTSLIIEDGVKVLGEEIIYCCSALEELVIPASVEKMSGATFGSESVTIKLDDKNQNYCLENGFVLNSEKDRLVKCILTDAYVENIIIPDTVKVIESYAFTGVSSGCVEIPSSVKKIADYAFSGRYGGKDSGQDSFFSSTNNVKFSEGLETIGDCAFAGAYFDKEIKLPNSLKTIGDEAFSCCQDLKGIVLSENLETIGKKAFYNCRSLEYVDLPSSLKSIGDKCFEGCENIRIVNISENLQKIPSRCFAGCASLEYVNYNAETLKEISPSAFFGCVNYLTIAVPDSVEEIGEMALGYGSATVTAPQTYSLKSRNIGMPKMCFSVSAPTYYAASESEQEETQESKNKEAGAQIPGTKIYAVKNSVAENYAKENELEFVDITSSHVCKPEWIIIKEATCSETGSRVLKCTNEDCENPEITTEVIETLEHSYSNWETTTEPTCSKQGVQTQKCTKCGDTQTQNIATIAHSFNENNICSVCNVNKNDLISLKPYGENLDKTWIYHKDGADRIAITFSSDTYLDSNDIVYIYSQEKNESQIYGDINNNWSGDSSIVEFKECYQWGDLQNQRRFFHDTDTVVVRLVTDGNKDEYSDANFEITMVEYFMDKCTHETTKIVGAYSNNGCFWPEYTGDTVCANIDCQKLIANGEYIYIPHTVTNWTTTTQGDCYNYGYEEGSCSECGVACTRSIEPSHQGEWVVTEATCTKNGEKYIDCTRCNERIVETIEAGHDYSDFVTTKEPTCSKQGIQTQYCSKCGDTQTRNIATVPHSFDDNNICTVCKVDKNDLVSLKPYGENLDEIWVYHKDGADRIAITFSSDTYLDGADYVYIYNKEAKDGQSYADIDYDDVGDENDSVVKYVGSYTYGNLQNKRVFVYDTDTVVVRLKTADFAMDPGNFEIVNVEYFTDVCEHTEKRTINQSSPTCQNMGNTGDIICANEDCKRILYRGDYIPTIPHSGEWVSSGVSTCTTNARKTRTCTECGETESVIVPSLSHEFNSEGICTVCNKTQVECFTLQKSSERNVEFDWVFAKEGATEIALTFSDDTYIDVYSAYGEDCIFIYNTIPEENQTYADLSYYSEGYDNCWAGQRLVIPTETGTVAIRFRSCTGFECSRLAITNVEYLTDSHECSGGTATCNERAVCSTCGEEYGGYDKTNHENIIFGGTKKVHTICDVCGELLSTTHKPTSKVTTAPTCTKEGVETFTCECGYTYTKSVAKSGHDYETTFTTDKESTCTEYGSKSRHCKNCNEKIDVTVIDMKGHAYDEGKVTTDATCTTTGIKTFTCGRCKVTKTSVVSAKGHKDVTVTGKAATCTDTGLTDGKKCSVCNKTTLEQQTIPSIGHKGVVIPAVAATCTAVGKTEGKKCSVCNEILVAQKDVAKVAHETTVVNKKDATCTAEGYTGDTQCTVCKTVTAKGTAVEKIAHKTTVVGAKKATAKEAGYTGDTKCTVCGTVTQKGTTIAKLTLAAPKVTQKNTEEGISLTWGKVANAESYRVYRRTYNTKTKKYSEWTTLSKAQKDTSFVDTKVKLGTTYSYMVKAINSGVLSKGTPTKNLKYNVTPTVKVVNASKGISVSWSPIANATGYEVYSSTYNAKTKKWSSFTKRATAKANAKSWTDTKAKSGTKYKYTVKALNGKVASVYNKSGVQIVRLAQPTTKIVNASNGIKVSWGKVTGATSYEILRAEYNAKTKKWNKAKKVATAKSSATSWTDTKVKSGVQYRYTVKAVNGKIYSSAKTTSGLMFLTMPKTTVKAVKNGVTVTWTQSTGATSYEVYRAEYNKKTKKYSGYKKVATAKSTAKSYTDKTAKKGVKYKYTVKAINNKTASAYKASAEVKR